MNVKTVLSKHSARAWFVGLAGLLTFVLLLASVTVPVTAGNGASSPARSQDVCNWTFVDAFHYQDPAPRDPLLAYMNGVTVGGEYYTSTAPGNAGVRLRDFRDSLDPATRPDGGNYTARGVWSLGAPIGGLAVNPPSGIAGVGVRMGGIAQTQSVPPRHANAVGLLHPLPAVIQNNSLFYFEYDWAMERAELMPFYQHLFTSGGNSVHLGGQNSRGHTLYYALGYGATSPGEIHAGAVDDYDSSVLWDVPLARDLPADAAHWYHGWMQSIGNGHMLMGVDSNFTQTTSGIENIMNRPGHISLNVSILNRDSEVWARYRNVWLTWITEGQIQSVGITRPAGTVYGQFDADSNGEVNFFLVNPVTGARTPIQPGDAIPDAYNLTGFQLRAELVRNDPQDASPVLSSWRVSTCVRATATPTSTPPPSATVTPTPTLVPTRTPRPTATPGAYFQIAPLRGYMHLKVAPYLDPPPPPDDESDWTEDEPVYYPIQAYVGLVPGAYTDAAVPPPQLCYWNVNRWTCVPGEIVQESYRFRSILHNGHDFLDPRNPLRPVAFARKHEFTKWARFQNRYTPEEYTWFNWLIVDSIVPVCTSGARCVVLEESVPGPYDIVYDVNGHIHWDAIPGVTGEYNFAFSQTYTAHISMVYSRPEFP